MHTYKYRKVSSTVPVKEPRLTLRFVVLFPHSQTVFGMGKSKRCDTIDTASLSQEDVGLTLFTPFANLIYSDVCPGDISTHGKAFIVALSFSGLGMFCGPLMDLASSWKYMLPIGGTIALLSSTVAVAVFVFSYMLEEMTETEAAYFSIITGTYYLFLYTCVW